MTYNIVIYPDQKKYLPKVGDILIVTKVFNSTDMHWGKCVCVELELDSAKNAHTEKES